MNNFTEYLLAIVMLSKLGLLGSIIYKSTVDEDKKNDAETLSNNIKFGSSILSSLYLAILFFPFNKSSGIIKSKTKTMLFGLAISNIIEVLQIYEEKKDNNDKEDLKYYFKLLNMFFILATNTFVMTKSIPGTKDTDISKKILFITFVVTILSLSCLLYTSPSPRDLSTSRMPSSA